MTTSEEAFLSAMEREPAPVEAQKPVWREAEISVTRGLWRTHAMVHGVLEIVSRLAGRVRSMAEHGPKDYAEDSYAQGFRDGRRQVPPNFGGVNNPESKWSTWILGIVGVLIAGAVIGLTSAMFTMTDRMASVEAKVDMLIKDSR